MCAVSRKIHCDAGNSAANSTLVAAPIGIGPCDTTPVAAISDGSSLHHGHVSNFGFCGSARRLALIRMHAAKGTRPKIATAAPPGARDPPIAPSVPMRDEIQAHNATIEDRHWWFAARRHILRALVNEIAAGRRLAVVDVGCSTGGNAGSLADAHDVTGFDASETAVRLAGERFPQARFRRADELGPVVDAARTADLVLLMDVIEHVEDDFHFLSTIVSALRPGAHVVVTVPAHPELWSAHDVASQHWRRYTRERLERTWRDLPLESRVVSYCNALLAPLVRGARRLRGTEKPTHGTGADLAVPAAPINALLRWTFEREAGPLVRALREHSPSPYRDGISLLAVLRRTPGASTVQTKPSDVPRDVHRPEVGA